MARRSPALRKRIDNDFTYHEPDAAEDVAFYEEYRKRTHELALFLEEHVSNGRELSLALTKLEEAVFWGNAARARHGGP